MMVALLSAPMVFAAEEPEQQAPMPASEQPAAAQNASCPAGAACADEAWLQVESVTIAAENGDPLAQYTLAWLTETGQGGMEADAEEAQELYAKALPGLKAAADGGHADACLALAVMYGMGKGVEADAETAASYAARAAECCAKAPKAPDCCAKGGTCCKGREGKSADGGKARGCEGGKGKGGKGKGGKPACCDKAGACAPAEDGASGAPAPQGAH